MPDPIGPIPPPQFPRLLFFCTRIMPLTFCGLAVSMGITHYFFPPTKEQMEELERRRSRIHRDGGKRFPSDYYKKSNSQRSSDINTQATEKSDLDVFDPEFATSSHSNHDASK